MRNHREAEAITVSSTYDMFSWEWPTSGGKAPIFVPVAKALEIWDV